MIFSNEVSGEELSFKYYSVNDNQVYCLNDSITFSSDMTIGTAQNPQWLNGETGDEVVDIYGCTDELSCNYNPDATIDDGSCDGGPVDSNYDCDGNCIVELDCNGECGGSAELDECGICGGDNSTCSDCAGVPNGSSYEDECGTCDDDSSNDCVQDCAGEWGGNALEDECGICGGDNSTCSDCAGV